MEDPGPPGGREVQPGGVGLSHFYGCAEVVSAEAEDTVSEVSEAELRECEQGAGAAGPGAGGATSTFLPAPDFMAPAGEEEQGTGYDFRG